jgi:adenylate kinase
MRLVLLGAPGAGKGTQAIRAAEAYNLHHLATGDMLREAIAQGSALGQKVSKIVESGALVDDGTIIELIASRIENLDNFILDGFPRTLPQGESLRLLLAEMKKPLDGVIVFNVDEAAILERIRARAKEENRPDDNPETFQKRLATYHKETAPLLAFYRAEGLVHAVDGMAKIDSVAQAINGIIERIK